MKPVRVLIVDDEPELVSALVERLEIRGFDAVGLLDGAEAVKRVAQEPFDVAVVDLKMPGLSGLDVIQQMHVHQPELRCILLTGHGAADNPEKGRQCGAYSCVMKPVKIDVLTKMLEGASADAE